MNNVEILLRNGVRCVFVNGVEIGHVTRIETPREPGKDLRVVLEFGAESVTERAVSEQEWIERRAIAKGRRTPAAAVDIGAAICKAIDEANRLLSERASRGM